MLNETAQPDDSIKTFPDMFPAKAGPLEEVYALPRRLL
jgi:hypothetical protein